MDIQEEGEGRVLEESLNHPVVQVVEDGSDYAADHARDYVIVRVVLEMLMRSYLNFSWSDEWSRAKERSLALAASLAMRHP